MKRLILFVLAVFLLPLFLKAQILVSDSLIEVATPEYSDYGLLSAEFSGMYGYYNQILKLRPNYKGQSMSSFNAEREIATVRLFTLYKVKNEYDFIAIFTTDWQPEAVIGNREEWGSEMQHRAQEVWRFHGEYVDSVKKDKYFLDARNFFNSQVKSFSIEFDSSGSMYSNLVLKKSLAKYSPAELFWIKYFSEDSVDFIQSTPEERKVVREKLRRNNFPPFKDIVGDFSYDSPTAERDED